MALLDGARTVKLSEDGTTFVVEGMTPVPEVLRKGTLPVPTAPRIAELHEERATLIERLRRLESKLKAHGDPIPELPDED